MQAAIPIMALGQIVQGVAGYQQGKYRSRIADYNARQAEIDGVAEAAFLRDQGRVAIGKQIAGQAAGGLEIGIGSAVDALQETAINTELNILQARREARARARSYQQGGAMARMEGRAALTQGLFGAARVAFGAQRDYAAAESAAGYGEGTG